MAEPAHLASIEASTGERAPDEPCALAVSYGEMAMNLRVLLAALGAVTLSGLSTACASPCASLQDTCDSCTDEQVRAACESVVRAGKDDQCVAAETNYPSSGCR